MEQATKRRTFLSEETWAELLRAYVAGATVPELAERYGVSRSAIARRAAKHGMCKKNHPEAVYRTRPPSYRGFADKARALDIDLNDPADAREKAKRKAESLAAEGRLEEAIQVVRLARYTEQLRRSQGGDEPVRRDRKAETLPRGADGEPAASPWPRLARAEQRAPGDADWRTWLFMGGRGAGKTRAGAEWLAEQAEDGGRLALVGPSLHDVREVMIDGPSGLRNLPGRERPRFEASRRRLLWSNGAVAYAFSAEDPESLRGPQFGAAWADEFGVWRRGGDTLALLRMGLRLGERPRLVVTTTPRPIRSLRRLIAEPSCAVSRSTTAQNAAHLAPSFVEDLRALYGGTRLAAQELDGILVEGDAAALWRAEELQRTHGARPDRFDEVVVGVDPPASEGGDACGIVVAGRLGERAYVLADETAGGLSPLAWARRVAAAAAEWGAARVVAEANQGGDMVPTVLASAGVGCPVKLVHARTGKRARAEPIAALYEQGRVTHCAPLVPLEEELMALGGAEEDGGGSPDRADALVWALSDLMLARRAEPRIRVL